MLPQLLKQVDYPISIFIIVSYGIPFSKTQLLNNVFLPYGLIMLSKAQQENHCISSAH